MELLSPAEITAKASEIGTKKAHGNLSSMMVSGILAGIYIALGAAFSVTSISGMQGMPFGLMKLVAGLAFSLGLILVMIAGAELFTGNALLAIALLQKKISFGSFLKNLFVVYFSNFLGAVMIVVLLYLAQRHMFGGGIVGDTLVNIGIHKLDYGFLQAFSLGILCNILVCLGVWIAYSGKTTADKVLGIIFPITAFVACGFEHSVANMMYLPFTYFLKDISLHALFIGNLLPVTLGNIVGGALFVGVAYRFLYGRNNT